MSNSLQPHGLQHIRLPCPSLSPGVFSDLCPSSWWCHPTIASSVTPFSSCPQYFLASVFSSKLVLHIRWQSIGASASASVIPIDIQGCFHLRLTDLISLLFKGLSRVFSSTRVWKQFWGHFSMVQLLDPSIYDYLENHSFDYMDLYQ